jgi:hypothetical protein
MDSVSLAVQISQEFAPNSFLAHSLCIIQEKALWETAELVHGPGAARGDVFGGVSGTGRSVDAARDRKGRRCCSSLLQGWAAQNPTLVLRAAEAFKSMLSCSTAACHILRGMPSGGSITPKEMQGVVSSACLRQSYLHHFMVVARMVVAFFPFSIVPTESRNPL